MGSWRSKFPPIVFLGACMALAMSTAAEASYITGLADLRLIAVPTAQAKNGQAVTNLGDINGDGTLDLGFGAPGEDLGGTAPGAGAVSLLMGDFVADRPGASGIMRLFGDQAGEAKGTSMAGVGDVNGDGFDDFVIGSPRWDLGATQDVGRVTLHFGRASGVPTASAEFRGTQAASQFGSAIAGAGDVNGDGYADILIGAPFFDDAGRVDSGQVQLFLGGPGAVFDTTADATVAPTAAQSLFGASVAGAGDVNADGFSDILVGVPNASVGQAGEGAGLLFLGGAGAFNTTSDAAFESNQVGAGLGAAVVGAGDVNGDGFSDMALGAPFFDSGQTNEGGVFVFHGGTVIDTTVDRIVEKNVAGALFGSAIASGDSNGDGYSDLAIGVPLEADYAINEFGKVWITIGSATGLGAEDYPVRGLSSTTTAGRFGSSLAFVDYNADGYPELFVGAPEESGGAGRPAQGFTYMVRSGVRLSTAVDDTLDGTQAGAQLGHAIAAGDFNRDGLGDLAVGLPNYDTGSQNVGRVELYFGAAGGFNATPDAILDGSTAQARFGRAVAIGDFNGDGYGDLAVGAPAQTASGGEVHLFYGGPGAFNTTVARVLSIAQLGAFYGEVVANVGDLNGDGIADLGVGAPLADIGGAVDAGVAYLYLGTGAGIGSLPVTEFQGTASGQQMGWSIVGAGDVNGDGLGDMAIGARGNVLETGAFRILFGSSPFNSVIDQIWTGETTTARCTQGMANAGDVNGDGFSDLLVGCPNEEASFVGAGVVRLFRGGTAGLNIVNPAIVGLGPASGSQFGQSVAGGGDLDADGFADLVIGLPGRSQGGNTGNGGLRWYRGSAAGPVAATAADLSVPENNARLGASVVMTDLNGDGYSEIIGGAPGVAGSSADVGGMHLVFPSAIGRNGSAQQFRNAATPVDFQGDSQSIDSFFAVLDGLSPVGRERARLQVQACPSGVPFNTATCVDAVTANWQDLGSVPGSAVMVGNPVGLQEGDLYYWRARLLRAPVSVTQSGITAPANPARVSPWRRMRANADVAEIRIQDRLFRDSFE